MGTKLNIEDLRSDKVIIMTDADVDGASRKLIRVSVDEDAPGETGDLVERLMGKKPELRFQYIQENARFVEELDV